MDYQQPASRRRSIETEDRLLGGRILLAQPKSGYRVAIDPLLLAAAIAPRRGDRVLDAGCGTGAAALCLVSRTRHEGVVGIELNGQLAALARRNVSANGFDSAIAIVEASFRDFAAEHPGGFDQVMTNPPFYATDTHTPSPSPTRAIAHGESTLDLKGWVAAATDTLKPGGKLTLIHRADRIGSLLAALEGRFGAAAIFPLWPRAGSDAGRIIVSAIKGRRTLPRLMAGLILHRQDGSYTDDAERILRDAAPLDPGPASD